jgi:hypothetical protein
MPGVVGHGFLSFTTLRAINTRAPFIDTAKSWAILESFEFRQRGWAWFAQIARIQRGEGENERRAKLELEGH